MRQQFAKYLHELMTEDKNIFFLTGDLGMFVLDKLKKDFPKRFINCGASEQAMLDVAIGLAQAGKKVIAYSITPFVIYRPFEALRTYINHEKIPVLLVGSGRNKDYAHDGISHFADDVPTILGTLTNITQFYPEDEKELIKVVDEWYTKEIPAFLSLKK